MAAQQPAVDFKEQEAMPEVSDNCQGCQAPLGLQRTHCFTCERRFHTGCIMTFPASATRLERICSQECLEVHNTLGRHLEMGMQPVQHPGYPDAAWRLLHYRRQTDRDDEAATKAIHRTIARAQVMLERLFPGMYAGSGRQRFGMLASLLKARTHVCGTAPVDHHGVYVAVLVATGNDGRHREQAALTLRVLGKQLAEFSVVGARGKQSCAGAGTYLFEAVVKDLLQPLGIQTAVLPSCKDAFRYWTGRMGFSIMEQAKIEELFGTAAFPFQEFAQFMILERSLEQQQMAQLGAQPALSSDLHSTLGAGHQGVRQTGHLPAPTLQPRRSGLRPRRPEIYAPQGHGQENRGQQEAAGPSGLGRNKRRAPAPLADAAGPSQPDQQPPQLPAASHLEVSAHMVSLTLGVSAGEAASGGEVLAPRRRQRRDEPPPSLPSLDISVAAPHAAGLSVDSRGPALDLAGGGQLREPLPTDPLFLSGVASTKAFWHPNRNSRPAEEVKLNDRDPVWFQCRGCPRVRDGQQCGEVHQWSKEPRRLPRDEVSGLITVRCATCMGHSSGLCFCQSVAGSAFADFWAKELNMGVHKKHASEVAINNNRDIFWWRCSACSGNWKARATYLAVVGANGQHRTECKRCRKRHEEAQEAAQGAGPSTRSTRR